MLGLLHYIVPCSFDQKNKLLNLDYNYHIVCYFLSLFFFFFFFFFFISGSYAMDLSVIN
jgi:hypothetical protein